MSSDPASLRAAVRNVTTDYDQLATLLQDFFRQQSHLRQDNSTEVAFREFLGHRASKSRPALEQGLDWILAFYKFIWPVLLVFLVTKLQTGKSRPHGANLEIEDEGGDHDQPWSPGASALPNGVRPPSGNDGALKRYGSHPHRTSSGGSSRITPLGSTKSTLT
ncbi:hypothetical protein WJX73_003100 [Symbiochloris irregularis]|uniref:Uncharacterized protein n=1 Tax=Symbiochloris irregularis TaxID=706552 RepID=A0AAW1NYT9_9CHLO